MSGPWPEQYDGVDVSGCLVHQRIIWLTRMPRAAILAGHQPTLQGPGARRGHITATRAHFHVQVRSTPLFSVTYASWKLSIKLNHINVHVTNAWGVYFAHASVSGMNF